MNRIEASAPGKLMLFGEHAVVYGHPCIVTAVNQRIFVEVQEMNDDYFAVMAPEVGIDMYKKKVDAIGQTETPRSVIFLETLYKRFIEKYPHTNGVQVTTRSEFSSKFGFGSSSAVTVAFAKALTELRHVDLTNNELFDLCYQSVIDVQGVGSGFDLAAAIWGGTIYYVKPAKIVEQLSENELPITVGYTGIKADTVSLVKKVEEQKRSDPERFDEIFSQMTLITQFARTAILAADWLQVGRLMNENQSLLTQLSVSSVELDSLINASLSSDAYGAKLSGAGGGDCMIALTNEKSREEVELSIERVNGQVLRVQTNAEAARIETGENKNEERNNSSFF